MSNTDAPIHCKVCEMREYLDFDCYDLPNFVEVCPHRLAVAENEKFREELQEIKGEEYETKSKRVQDESGTR
ncbi:MAG: hypothetical protein GWN64_07845 [Candidatus Thorarchaeota archaeon]|nr:hypothetical protein [Candidatus Thorarchaeota archaeon]